MGLVVAVLVGVGFRAIPGSPVHKSPTLGLDLQGGLEVVLKAVPPKGHKLTTEDLDRSVTIMRNRVDKLGVSEPEIRKQGSDQIVIELPGVKNPKQAFDLIGKTAQLELFDLEADLTGPSINSQGFPVGTPNLFNLLASQQARAKTGTPNAYYLFDAKKRLVAGPEDSRQGIVKDRDRLVAAAISAQGGGKAAKTSGAAPNAGSGGGSKKAGTTKTGANASRTNASGTNPKSYTIFAVPKGTIVLLCGLTDR